jgi:hypothetical protein
VLSAPPRLSSDDRILGTAERAGRTTVDSVVSWRALGRCLCLLPRRCVCVNYLITAGPICGGGGEKPNFPGDSALFAACRTCGSGAAAEGRRGGGGGEQVSREAGAEKA